MSEPSGRGNLTLTPSPAAAVRPSVIQLVFREKGALYAAYMPVFSDAGLFVPTTGLTGFGPNSPSPIAQRYNVDSR